MEELVFNNNGKLVTNSLMVAKKFGKRHTHVLDTIKTMIHSAENSAQFYQSGSYFDSTGRELPMFIMDRDGFSLIVMGFTGKDAIKFKLDFIAAFNKMESQLKSINSMEPEEMLLQSVQLMIEQKKRLSAVENRVNVLEAKTKTTIEHFTIVGYATLNKMQIGLQLAAKLGQKAARICKIKGYIMEEIPDPRFGRVRTYPKIVLEQVFNERII